MSTDLLPTIDSWTALRLAVTFIDLERGEVAPATLVEWNEDLQCWRVRGDGYWDLDMVHWPLAQLVDEEEECTAPAG